MNHYEEQYRELVQDILDNGELRDTRTGQTRALFNKAITVDLRQGFPMLSGRQIKFNTVRAEFLWMMAGSTNANWLHKYRVHIWDQWAKPSGELGPTYGSYIHKQWSDVENVLANDPMGRRHIIELWDVSNLNKMALPPCYHSLQFYVTGDSVLNLSVQFRSSDVAVGLPHDIPTLALLLHRMVIDLKTDYDRAYTVGTLHCNLVDVHVNEENAGAMYTYLTRQTTERLPIFKYKDWLTSADLDPCKKYDLTDYKFDERPFPKLIVKP